MIEEISDEQFIKHHLEKVFNTLGHSPEEFLRYCLDFVEGKTKILSQPGAEENLIRLMKNSACLSDQSGEHEFRANSDLDVETTDRNEGKDRADAHENSSDDHDSVATTSLLVPNSGNGADMERYSWTQTLSEVVVTVPVPRGTKGKTCDVEIQKTKLKIGIKGDVPVIDGELFAPVKPDDCLWNLVDSSLIEVSLMKVDAMQWWRSVVKGEQEIDTQKVEPEASKLEDLDPEMRGTVEKMMFDQRQKAMGLPTTEEQERENALKKFMEAHPEMDFSNAKIM